MRLGLRRLAVIVALLAIACCFSGCIVWYGCPWCDRRPPRMATLHVYVSDYYTGYPVSWATVDLYEEHWWYSDYLGSWPVNGAGYAQLLGGYLYWDGEGGDEERDFLVAVRAHGYCGETYEIELDYYYPSETLHFLLVPCYSSDDGSEPEEVPEDERPEDRIRTGEEAAPNQGE